MPFFLYKKKLLTLVDLLNPSPNVSIAPPCRCASAALRTACPGCGNPPNPDEEYLPIPAHYIHQYAFHLYCVGKKISKKKGEKQQQRQISETNRTASALS
eukprot:gene9695-6792_t